MENKLKYLINEAMEKLFLTCGWNMPTASTPNDTLTADSLKATMKRVENEMNRSVIRPTMKNMLRYGSRIGLAICENPMLTKHYQFRFPRCKSKRIAKKWRKDKRNWRTVPDPNVYIVNNKNMFAHPVVARDIRTILGDNLTATTTPWGAW